MTLTELMKKLVFDVMPPTEGSKVYQINQEDMLKIYKIISDERIDFEDLPEPKKDFIKGILAKLGFQVLSLLRRKYMTRTTSTLEIT